MRFATKTIHAAQPSDTETGALIAPIYQTSTFEQITPGEHRGFDYSRTNNPTRQRLERVLAELEGVQHGAVFASGLAAENAILQAYLRPGDEVIVPQDVYGGTYRLLTRVFAPLGCRAVMVDTTDVASVEAALGERTRLVWLESPTNPRLLVSDIAAIARAAHACGALVVVDNTFATPVFQQPFALGADLVIHSVTKYLAGHSDLIQGAVLAKDAAVFEPVKFLQNATGAVPSPFDCWLTLRGLKTLELRMLRHAENAARIAEALTAHPAVARVYYPGLASHPGHQIAKRQMSGFGGMVSFEMGETPGQGGLESRHPCPPQQAGLKARPPDMPRPPQHLRDEHVTLFVSSRRYFALGESLGGVKSLICHPARMTHASIPAEARQALGLRDTLIRLSPGVEHPDDLVEDIVSGLDQIVRVREEDEAAVS